MKIVIALLLTALFSTVSVSQGNHDLSRLIATEAEFIQVAGDIGPKKAFLKFLAPDAVLFQPQAVNGHEYWNRRVDKANELLVRKAIYADISANGLLGYTTGNWRLYDKGKSESSATYGQYATIWERSPEGGYRATLDISIEHDKLPFTETDRIIRVDAKRDLNKRGWSPADASMNFLRKSMLGSVRLGGAYEEFAAKDVRLLLAREAPILGKKKVVREMNRYLAVEFPTKITAFQSADLAYTWNPCRFTNNEEGFENGNCLHIWKLRDKKWWIVLGVFAPIPNDKPPVLKGVSRR
ncbi:MAG TPA: hypothetical protein VFZ23_14660 [Pyrinomonadaceae bacterium]